MKPPCRVCSFCVMDTEGADIRFDEKGECDCCRDARARMPSEWHPGNIGRRMLDGIVAQLKADGRDNPYECMVGLSGGLDSAYLAYVLRRDYNLRMLALHVDGGWNSEAAVRNIEMLVRRLDIDLHTYVVEWDEMRDLQVAFLRASVLNQDIPQDHAFFAMLYRTAYKRGLRHFMSGVNFSSECIVPPHWGYPSMDGHHLRAIHRRFGSRALDTFPVMGVAEFVWLTRVVRKLRIHRPLDLLPYSREVAQAELSREIGWKDYGAKHSESRFTRFYQQVYLPARYGFDKRRLHLSSLIVTGQVTREQALAELAKPICDRQQAQREVRFVAKKLRMSADELTHLIAQPSRDHLEFGNSLFAFNANRLLKDIRAWVGYR